MEHTSRRGRNTHYCTSRCTYCHIKSKSCKDLAVGRANGKSRPPWLTLMGFIDKNLDKDDLRIGLECTKVSSTFFGPANMFVSTHR